MTAMRPGFPPPSPTTGDAPLVPSSCRVSILVGDSHQIDLVLPAAVPLSALAEATRDAVNRILRTRGDDELPRGAYVFARAAGMTALAARPVAGRSGGRRRRAAGVGARHRRAALRTQHRKRLHRAGAVRPGALPGRLGPRRRRGRRGADRRRAGGGGGDRVADAVGRRRHLGACRGLRRGRGGAVRRGADRLAHGGSGVPSSTAPRGPGWSPRCWRGRPARTAPHPRRPHAFLASLVAIVGALMLARFTGRHWTAAAAVITVAAAGFGAAAVRMFFAVPGQRIAVVMLVAVLVAARVAPSMGLWMAKVPRQSFGSITGRDLFARAPGQPEDTMSPVESAAHDVTLRGEQVAEVARRSNRVLTGALLGVGVVQVVSSWFAIAPGQRQPVAVGDGGRRRRADSGAAGPGVSGPPPRHHRGRARRRCR